MVGSEWWLTAQIARLKLFRTFKKGWDSYNAEPPNESDGDIVAILLDEIDDVEVWGINEGNSIHSASNKIALFMLE